MMMGMPEDHPWWEDWRDYIVEPLRLRGMFGLRYIGMQHTFFDAFLCFTQVLPPIMVLFGPLLRELHWWFVRFPVAITGVSSAAVAFYAVGLLFDDWMWLDRITALLYAICLWTLLFLTAPRFPFKICLLIFTVAILHLMTFHRRLYFARVKRQWRPARAWGRIWHGGAFLVPLLIFLMIDTHISKVPKWMLAPTTTTV